MRGQRNITNPDIAKALAHPLRVRILAVLEDRTASPRELSEILDAELTVVSYHVRRLAAAKLIKLVDRKQRRGAIEHYYEAVPKTTITSEAWADVPSVAKSSMVSVTVDQIGKHVARGAAAGGFERGDAHLSRTPVVLDQRGWSQVARKLDRLMEEFDYISEQSRKRMRDRGSEDAIEAQVVLMLFESAPAPVSRPGRASAAGRKKRVRST
jgi:DNA-binding transcriptional ArsR family regulator